MKGPARTILVTGLSLVLFSIVFSLAAWYGWWPRLPPGALHDTDLWAGLPAGVALLLLLLRRGSANGGSSPSRAGDPDRTESSAPES